MRNDSDFGLGSSVWTRDEAGAMRFVSWIEAGMTCVNAMVASDPRLPRFGSARDIATGLMQDG